MNRAQANAADHPSAIAIVAFGGSILAGTALWALVYTFLF